jgi:pimeloyl-ACP methyl ester carboxylesterase
MGLLAGRYFVARAKRIIKFPSPRPRSRMPRTLVRMVQTLFDPVYRRIAIGVLLGGLVYMSVLFCALTHRLLGSGGSTRGIAREINTDTDSPDVLITLVHGTIFFRRSNWTQDNSEFRAALARGLQARVQFKDFRWSGRNSFYARRKAAVQLKQDLRRNLKSYPEARHFVIGHSHGGSVSALALADEKLANRTQGLICLATPFLHINQGDALLVFGRYVSALFVTILLVSFPLFWLFGVSRLSLSERSLEGFAIGFLSGLLCLGTVFVFRRSALRAHRSVRAAAAAPALQLNRLLILRHTGDEASAILASGYIWTWATTNLVKRLYFVASVVKQPPWVRLVRPLWGTILFLLPTMWTLDAFQDGLYVVRFRAIWVCALGSLNHFRSIGTLVSCSHTTGGRFNWARTDLHDRTCQRQRRNHTPRTLERKDPQL